MTPSTTNTAARELLELIDQYWDLAHAEGLEGRMTDTEAGDAQRCRHEIESRIKALTQQQGGEQEALDHLIDSLEAVVIDWAAGADKPQPGRDRIMQDSIGILIPRLRRTALRTKQPAASEGETINGVDGGTSAPCTATTGQAKQVQTADTPPSTTANTSKQAAGEDCENMIDPVQIKVSIPGQLGTTVRFVERSWLYPNN